MPIAPSLGTQVADEVLQEVIAGSSEAETAMATPEAVAAFQQVEAPTLLAIVQELNMSRFKSKPACSIVYVIQTAM